MVYTMIDKLIKQQLDIINKAKTIKRFTDYDFNNLIRVLMVLEKLKKNKGCKNEVQYL